LLARELSVTAGMTVSVGGIFEEVVGNGGHDDWRWVHGVDDSDVGEKVKNIKSCEIPPNLDLA